MFPKPFKKLIDHFSSLPSVGPKMAERLVLYLFKQEKDEVLAFGKAIEKLKTDLSYCEECGNISEGNACDICKDDSRDHKIICVVEDALDIIAIERTKKYHGIYHVLGGTLGTTFAAHSQELKISELEKRAKNNKLTEIILATNPTTEGDATALYISRIFKPTGIKITRLARGLSTGGDIEYADEITLGSAIINRK